MIYISMICVFQGGEIWIYALHEGKIIHQISEDLTSVISSIGGNYDNEDMANREKSRSGFLACSDKYIFSGFVSDNKMSIYNKEEDKLYKSFKFEEISPIDISLTSAEVEGGFSYNYYTGEAYDERGNYHDELKNMVVIEDYVLVQYERYFEENTTVDEQQIISLLVNTQEDTYQTSDKLPFIFDNEGNSYLTGLNNPLPQVKIITIK